MTHQEKRGSSLFEGIYGFISGSIYGIILTLSGHPIDTIKTRIQTHSNINITKHLYKGVIPSMLGSSIYRSSQFAIFEGIYTKFKEKNILQQHIPGCYGLEKSTIVSGFIASGCRSILESPVEYIKVQKQTGSIPKYTLNNLYKGFPYQYIRTTGLMTTYFCSIDVLRKNTTLFDSLYGQFIASACSATLGYWIIWPFEVIKNQHQSGIIKYKIKDLYRGIIPGTICIFWSNGWAMIAMQFIQKILHNNING